MPRLPSAADLIGAEQLEAVKTQPVLTTTQLHLLRQQIEALRRINVQLRVLKFRRRTGSEPAGAPSGGPSRGGGGRGRGRGRGGRGASGDIAIGGRGRGRGRGRGKRGREDESEDDDSIVARSSEEEEEGAGCSSESSEEDEEGLLSSSSADSEESEDDYTLPVVDAPRRTGRMRRPSSAAAMREDEDEGESSGEEEEGQQQQQQQQVAPAPAGPQEEQQGERQPRGDATVQVQACPAKPRPKRAQEGGDGGDGKGGGKKRGLFMLVEEDTSASTAAVHLRQLKPVRPPKGVGGGEDEDEAFCSVCGDVDAVEGNLLLLCEGKGCSVAVHQQCYGVHEVPEGKWLCDGCKARLKPAAANCCVCPVVGGAVKKVTSLGRVVLPGGARAAHCHLACALWVPEIELADHENMAGVALDKMTAVRAKLRCEICKQAGGAAVQCVFGTCCRSFHVLCGRAAGQQLTFRETDGEPLPFCELHSKPAFEKLADEYIEGKRALELRGSLPEEEEEGGAGDAGGD